MKFAYNFIYFLGIVKEISFARAHLTERFHWSPIDYAFQEVGIPADRTSYRFGDYTVRGVYPWKDKLFLSIEYFLEDNPSGKIIPLTYFNFDTAERSPLLIPYPKRDLHRIQSASYLEVDPCDRLWFVDSETSKILIVDLNQSKIIREVSVNSSGIRQINTITVEVNKLDCDNAHAYLANYRNYQILVYRFKDNKYWTTGEPRFLNHRHKDLKFNGTGNGVSFTACSEADHNGDRVLYLQPLKSAHLLAVSTSGLRNSVHSSSGGGGSSAFQNVTVFGTRGHRHFSTVLHYDQKNAILFFDLYAQHTLGCWNAKRFPNEFSANTTHVFKLPAGDRLAIQDLKIDVHENLIIQSKTLITNFSTGELEYDLPLYTVNVKELVKDTVCDSV